jgi:hypothetical protein
LWTQGRRKTTKFNFWNYIEREFWKEVDEFADIQQAAKIVIVLMTIVT